MTHDEFCRAFYAAADKQGQYDPHHDPEWRPLIDFLWAELQSRLVVPEGLRAEVRLNDDKTLDEVVCRGDQLEQMDFNHWFLSLGDVAVWLHAKGKITATYERREMRHEPQDDRK